MGVTGSWLAKLKRLYESDIIGIMFAETGGRVKEANDALLRMIGYTREDIESGALRWDRITPPEWQAQIAGARAQIAQFGMAEPMEKEYVHKNGSRVPILIGIARLEGSQTETVCFVLDNSARKRVEEAEALARSEQQLRLLAARAEKASEAERARLAREVHDVLGQELTGLKMDVAWVSRRMAQTRGNDLVTARLQSMLGRIDSVIGTVRRIATDLRPGALDDLGLCEAIEGHVREFQARSGLAVEVATFEHDVCIDRARTTALFRILQELLTNVARHASAANVRVALRAEGDTVVLSVEDDGVGITPDRVTSSSSLGLLGVRERALVFGGDCRVEGVAGRGTKVEVRIPLVDRAGATRGAS
jgi:PAS domain S-box-containing protein